MNRPSNNNPHNLPEPTLLERVLRIVKQANRDHAKKPEREQRIIEDWLEPEKDE